MDDKRVCIFHLYGTDGIGSVATYAYVAQVSATPSDVGGVDEIVEMSVTAIPNTVAKKVTDEYTVVDNKDGSFTVSKGVTRSEQEMSVDAQNSYYYTDETTI